MTLSRASGMRWPTLAAAVVLSFIATSTAATPDVAAEREIEHLLQFVATSGCTFVRNGTAYPADKAREHLASKYRYARSRLATAEDFIKHLASDSSSSGEPYRIVCDRKESLAGAWLSEELRRYRGTSAPVR
jgi:hypothetical protein